MVCFTLDGKWVSYALFFFNCSKYLNMCDGQRYGYEHIKCHFIMNGSLGIPFRCPRLLPDQYRLRNFTLYTRNKGVFVWSY